MITFSRFRADFPPGRTARPTRVRLACGDHVVELDTSATTVVAGLDESILEWSCPMCGTANSQPLSTSVAALLGDRGAAWTVGALGVDPDDRR